MDPLAHGAIRFRQFGDFGDHLAFPVGLIGSRLHLFDAILHRASFVVRESLESLFGRGGVLGGLMDYLNSGHAPVLAMCLPGALLADHALSKACFEFLWVDAFRLTLDHAT